MKITTAQLKLDKNAKNYYTDYSIINIDTKPYKNTTMYKKNIMLLILFIVGIIISAILALGCFYFLMLTATTDNKIYLIPMILCLIFGAVVGSSAGLIYSNFWDDYASFLLSVSGIENQIKEEDNRVIAQVEQWEKEKEKQELEKAKKILEEKSAEDLLYFIKQCSKEGR